MTEVPRPIHTCTEYSRYQGAGYTGPCPHLPGSKNIILKPNVSSEKAVKLLSVKMFFGGVGASIVLVTCELSFPPTPLFSEWVPGSVKSPCKGQLSMLSVVWVRPNSVDRNDKNPNRRERGEARLPVPCWARETRGHLGEPLACSRPCSLSHHCFLPLPLALWSAPAPRAPRQFFGAPNHLNSGQIS